MLDCLMLAEVGISELLTFYALPMIGSVLLAFAIFNLTGDLRKTESRKIVERLKGRTGFGTSERDERLARESILRQTQSPTSGLGAIIGKLKLTEKIQRVLDQADLPWFATGFLINLVGFSALAFIISYFLDASLWVEITAGAGAFIVPMVILYVKRNMRLNRLMRQLPDVFDLMSQGLRAGHSLANAILLIAEQLPDPIATEFARVFHEQNLGVKIEDALQNMAKRIGLMDVRFFVTAVLIQRSTGGDLAEVLDNISGVIRDRIKLFGTVKALTAEGRLSGWVLLALPIVVFIMELVVNPKYANVLLDDPMGRYMLMGAAIAQILGLAMIKKIVNIKV